MVLFSVTIGLMALYAWYRCVRRMVLAPWLRRSMGVVLLLLSAASVGYIPLRRSGLLGDGMMELFATAVGAVFLFFALAVIYDLVMLLGRWWLRRTRYSDRWRLGFDLGVIGVACVLLLLALYGGQRAPQVTQVSVPIDGMSESLRIVHLTDLHLGNSPRLGRHFAAGIVEQVNALQPDLIVITGDLVDAPLEKVSSALAVLGGLKSRYGSYFVPGNHEYFHGVEAINAAVADQNITPLLNENRTLQTHAGTLSIVGLTDPTGRRFGLLEPDSQAAFRGVPSALPTLVLSHQPILAQELPMDSFDLFLAGHTHGGQIFPFGLLVRTEQPYLRGLYRHDGRGSVFVSSGAGYWGPPMRLFAPAEIALITWEAR